MDSERPAHARRRRRSGDDGLRGVRRHRVLRIVAVLLGFIVAGVAGAVAYFLPVAATALQSTGQGGLPADTTSRPDSSSGNPFTVLLLGSDNDAKFSNDHLLTQSMILVRVVPKTNQVTMLSIPRDLWVPITRTSGSAKVMSAYANGGAANAIATVDRAFGVHVDHYVWTGLRGLVELIDAVGGIDVVTSNPVLDDQYPADLSGGNPYDVARVAVLPGAQHLNGVHALEYVRSRHGDIRGDFGRSERQQQVLLALRAKAKALSFANVPDLAAAVNGQVSTDMGIRQIGDLLPLIGGINIDSVNRIILLPPYTSSAQIAGQDVLLPDWSRIRPLVAQSFPS
jgi:LCP family protein required for cell wall assembly